MSDIRSVLFVCNLNSVRSPMAAALLAHLGEGRVRADSAGVWEGAVDPFVPGVLAELGLDLGELTPKAIDDIDLGNFDLLVALTPRAHEALKAKNPGGLIEEWAVDNPTDTYGSREQIMDAYRALRDDLAARLRRRFPEIAGKA